MLKIWAGIIAGLALIFAASLFLPDEVALSIESPGKILPIKEWRLIQSADGGLRGTLQDHELGTVNSYAINRFERGDAIQFTLNKNVFGKRFLSAGDTIGTIYSSEINLRLTDLQGELATRQASLRMFAAGEKPPLIDEARQGILRAESRAKEHTNVLARLRQLFEQELIAEEELQAAESLQEVYNADVAIAKAQLTAREMGARQEQIDLTRTEVQALQASIDALKKRLQFQTLISPINGYVARSFAPDTLLTIRDTTGFLVLMPIHWRKSALLETGATVQISIPDTEEEFTGELLDIGDTIHRINGEQVVPAIARVTGYYPQILPNMMVNATLGCGKVSLTTYLKHRLN
ncbi:MAG: HlyD family secretion protein [Rhodothermales bacterium]